MAGRSSRSPAGAHSTTSPISPSRIEIEDVLGMRPIPSPRAQRMPNTPSHPPSRRSLYDPQPQHGHSSPSVSHGDGALGNGAGASRSSPIMPSAASSRSASRAASMNFIPRIVRGTIAERDAASASSNNGNGPSTRAAIGSTPRQRRSSSSAATTQGAPRTVSSPPAPTTIVPPPSHAVSFPRPRYLEHSALRHYIQSDSSPDVPPDRYRFDSLRTGVPPVAVVRPRDAASPSREIDSDEDSSVSTREGDQTAPPSRASKRKPVDTVMQLPTRWSDQDRCPSLSVSADGRELTFHGPLNQGEKEAAAARTNCPAPAACGIYYYEIEILNKGQKGHISIGFGTSSVRLSRLPGWEGQSWGYHGDDGNSFASEREGSKYGPKFTTGDTVGCGIDYSQGRAFFTKNGRFLDYVFENLGSVGDMYPSVGLRTQNEAIRANFGHEPFKFDISAHVEQERNRTWARIQDTAVIWTPPGTFSVNPNPHTQAGEEGAVALDRPVNELILAYLAHHGYAKTARAFKTQTDSRVAPSEPAIVPADDIAMEMDGELGTASAGFVALPDAAGAMQDDTLKRQRIVHAIIDGDMDTALDETRAHYPQVLEREEGLVLFKLRCRKFVELVLDAATALRTVRKEEARAKGKDVAGNRIVPDSESMDVDDEGSATVLNGSAPHTTKALKAKPPTPSMGMYQLALTNALAFGQALQADYKADARPDVQVLFKRTLSLVAYDDPLAEGAGVPEAVKEMAGQAAREHLAEDINCAILESQGRPPHPALERLYRQTQACVMQLGWLGVGAAAFADMPKEFLDA